jgi:hypothetical protein
MMNALKNPLVSSARLDFVELADSVQVSGI